MKVELNDVVLNFRKTSKDKWKASYLGNTIILSKWTQEKWIKEGFDGAARTLVTRYSLKVNEIYLVWEEPYGLIRNTLVKFTKLVNKTKENSVRFITNKNILTEEALKPLIYEEY